VGLLFADGGGLREPSGELQSAAVGRRRTARLGESQNSHASANPAAGTISDKGRPRRRSVKIGDLLIASKVPKASDLAKPQGRPRNRFTAADFGATFWPHKRLHKKRKCSSQNCAGRSLPPAEARYSHSLIHAVSPQAAARVPKATLKPPKITPQSGALTRVHYARARFCDIYTLLKSAKKSAVPSPNKAPAAGSRQRKRHVKC